MFYHIINECEVQLWSVPQRERIHKLIAKIGNFTEIDELSTLSGADRVLVIQAEYLFDANVLAKLIDHPQAILTDSSNQVVVAAWVEIEAVEKVKLLLGQVRSSDNKLSIPIFTPQQLTGGYDPRLRKFNLSHVVKVSAERQQTIENYMYDKSYKGITDLVTKWWWPLPARGVVRKCVERGITPNMVTSFGWLLTILTGVAFYFGYFVLGLLSAWVMTFLDTVDGKLARVTLQTSKVGHVMDHGLDIIHPPIWYWCWAVGLQVNQFEFLGLTWSINSWFWILFAAYVGGRVFEGLFQLSFNDISIFCWRPFDSYHRLITARRNPCLILLTVAIVFFDPVLGFAWIVAWTVFSTLLLAVRFFTACMARLIKGPLESWIGNIDPQATNPSLATKWFTGYQALKTIEPIVGSVK